jgi:hypothetical protein
MSTSLPPAAGMPVQSPATIKGSNPAVGTEVPAGSWGDLHLAVLREVNWGCLHCGGPGQIDHVKPRHAGGQDVPVNLAVLCEPCNKIKSCWWPGHGYHPWPGYVNAEEARKIAFTEIDWLAGRHDWSEVDEALWGAAGEPGTWMWREPADGPWLAAWC